MYIFVPVRCGPLQFKGHITVLKVSIQLFVPVWCGTLVLNVSIQLCVPVWCGTLQILKFDRIIFACMVGHITVYKV